MSGLRENHREVDQRIRAACARAGRDPADVRLIWVSKNHPRQRLLEAVELGAVLFGENRVQEALEKFPLPASASGGPAPASGAPAPASGAPAPASGAPAPASGAPIPALHFIGRLQKNKIRKILPLAAAIHSIDSLDLLEAVDRIAGEMGCRPDVFLQVNTSREPAKGGFEPDALPAALAALPPLPNLRLVGLMTMGPLETPTGEPAGPEAARLCFRELAGLLRSVRAQASSGAAASDPLSSPLQDLAWLSMGMTGDFEVAIEEGAHFVRVGTGLFGARGSHG